MGPSREIAVSASAILAIGREVPTPPGRTLRILFVTSRFPHPPLKGDQLRALHQIRRLGERHRITLAYLSRGPAAAHEALAASCERIVAVPFGPVAMALGLMRGAFSGLPLQASLYETRAMRTTLRLLAADPFDLVHVQLARMAPYLEEGVLPRPWVVDLVDALSLGMERRSLEDRGPLRLVARMEALRLRRYERQLAALADRTVVVSRRDREAIGDLPGLCIVPNAVDLEAFPFADRDREPATIVFSGNMGYFPNANAAVWFCREILPRVRRSRPDARLLIVGSRPARSVRALAQDGAVTVTGRVEDVGSYLRRATVAVVPMRSGSGQQFKILEAMASGAPVVATAAEAAQIGAEHDRELLVADAPLDFAAAVVSLLEDRAKAALLAKRARNLVESRFTWSHSVDALESAYLDALRERSTVPASGARTS
jgi:sugar transferase (PEP-CTERM/EpsH1 system associated)